MHQTTLFEHDSSRGMYRRSDPETSREAAIRSLKSGRRNSQRLAVWEVVQQNDGLTSAEIGQLLKMGDSSRWIAARRLPELAKIGLVCRGDRRTCKVQGTNAVTWWMVGE